MQLGKEKNLRPGGSKKKVLSAGRECPVWGTSGEEGVGKKMQRRVPEQAFEYPKNEKFLKSGDGVKKLFGRHSWVTLASTNPNKRKKKQKGERKRDIFGRRDKGLSVWRPEHRGSGRITTRKG